MVMDPLKTPTSDMELHPTCSQQTLLGLSLAVTIFYRPLYHSFRFPSSASFQFLYFQITSLTNIWHSARSSAFNNLNQYALSVCDCSVSTTIIMTNNNALNTASCWKPTPRKRFWKLTFKTILQTSYQAIILSINPPVHNKSFSLQPSKGLVNRNKMQVTVFCSIILIILLILNMAAMESVMQALVKSPLM